MQIILSIRYAAGDTDKILKFDYFIPSFLPLWLEIVVIPFFNLKRIRNKYEIKLIYKQEDRSIKNHQNEIFFSIDSSPCSPLFNSEFVLIFLFVSTRHKVCMFKQIRVHAGTGFLPSHYILCNSNPGLDLYICGISKTSKPKRDKRKY